tara:strand:- start:1033 stop:1326 length:294 start_codon:yes stop_codon:yes gene_type:complete
MRGPDFLRVYDRMGGEVLVRSDQENYLDAAVTSFVSSGCQREEVLSLTTLDGGEYHVLVSTVTSWVRSTPEARRFFFEVSSALTAEEASFEPKEWEG